MAYPEAGYAWVATRDPDPELLARGGDPGIIARFEIPVEESERVARRGSRARERLLPGACRGGGQGGARRDGLRLELEVEDLGERN